MAQDNEKAPDWRGKVLGDIAGHLKGYPFLLLALGISLVFVLTIGFLDEGKTTGIVLFMAVVLLLIVMQFVLEFNKAKKPHPDEVGQGADPVSPEHAGDAGQSGPARPVGVVPAHGLSGKAIASLVMSILVLLGAAGLSAEELADIEMQTGLLMLSMVAGVLGISAWHDARANKVKGGGMAIAGMVISSILILSSLGWIGKKNVPPDYLPEAGHLAAPTAEAQINFQQGLNYARSRDWTPAISEFSVAIQKDPNYAAAYANRAIAYMQQGKLNKAHQDLSEAVRIAPKDPLAHYNLAALYSLQNQPDLALDELDHALAADFNDYDALRGDPDLANLRAQPEFRKVLEKHKIFLN